MISCQLGFSSSNRNWPYNVKSLLHHSHFHNDFYQRVFVSCCITVTTGLVFSEYLLSGQAPPVKEVNDEEPLFPALHFFKIKSANKVSSVLIFLPLLLVVKFQRK